MCGRASLSKQEKELQERFGAGFYEEDIARYNPLPSFNIAPTQWHPVITNEDPDQFRFYKWGLIPFWAKDERIGSRMINARMETLQEKPAFRIAYQKRRCLVPFDGFYEWKKNKNGQKQPYLIGIDGGALFSIAGLWETWKDENGEIIPSFTLITMPPNPLMAAIHNRMPAILLPEHEKLWLQEGVPAEDLQQLLIPFPEDHMHAFPVSTRINRVSVNDITLTEPIGPELHPDEPPSGPPPDLFNQIPEDTSN
ncbi:MAG: SOS response-associated peptidase [Saprospiraceae bacterium]|nr:SOS response-associated peptidase [Saprospiraceae bacterium]